MFLKIEDIINEKRFTLLKYILIELNIMYAISVFYEVRKRNISFN